VATSANQMTFHLVLENRLFGRSTIAQSVGSSGMRNKTKTINILKGSKDIEELRATCFAPATNSLERQILLPDGDL
jgi:hypothetical protein